MPRGFDLSKKKLSEFEERNRSPVRTTAKKPNYLRAAVDLSNRPYQNQENIEYWKGVFRRTGEVAKENVKAAADIVSKVGGAILGRNDASIEDVTAATLMGATGIGGKTRMKIPTKKDVAVGKFARLAEKVEKDAKKAAFSLDTGDWQALQVLKKHGQAVAKEAQRYPDEYWDMIKNVGYEPMEGGVQAYVGAPNAKSKQIMRFNKDVLSYDTETDKFITPITEHIPEIMRHEFGHVARDDRLYPGGKGRQMSMQEHSDYIYEERPTELMAFEAGINIPENEAAKLTAEYLDKHYAAAEARVKHIKNTMEIQDDLVEAVVNRALANKPTEDIQGVVQAAIRELDKGLTKGRGRADELEETIYEMLRMSTEDNPEIYGYHPSMGMLGDTDSDIPFYIDKAKSMLPKPKPMKLAPEMAPESVDMGDIMSSMSEILQ